MLVFWTSWLAIREDRHTDQEQQHEMPGQHSRELRRGRAEASLEAEPKFAGLGETEEAQVTSVGV